MCVGACLCVCVCARKANGLQHVLKCFTLVLSNIVTLYTLVYTDCDREEGFECQISSRSYPALLHKLFLFECLGENYLFLNLESSALS